MMIKILCIRANIWRWVHCFSPSYDISCFIFLLKQTSNYVGWLRSYRVGFPWWLFWCCTTCQKMRANGITTFILHVSQCITFNKTKFVAATLIAEAPLKSLYSRLVSRWLKMLRHLLVSKRLANDFVMSKQNPKYFRNKKLAYNIV